MGAFLKCYNPKAVHHVDLIYDAKNCHVDVITSMKGLFDARHFCYSFHKVFSTVKHLCAASGCMLCRPPGCLNLTGFINPSPMIITTTTTSSSQGSFQGKLLQLQCNRCRLKLRTEKCLDCHVSSGICHLYSMCLPCNNTVAKRALSNHICSKKRCTISAVYYPNADCKANSHKMAEHQCFVQKPINHNKAASVNSGLFHDFQSQNIDDGVKRREPAHQEKIDPKAAKQPNFDEDGPEGMEKNIVRSCSSAGQIPSDDLIWVLDIETDQSCADEGLHKPILLTAESLVAGEKIYLGYDCINKFCGDVFSGTERVRQTEWFTTHFGSGFDFLPILEWLFRQQKYIPKTLLRGNKIVSMRVGNKKCIDSYPFIPIPLSKFTSTFNLKGTAKKYFPHFLTSKEALSPTPGSELHNFRSCNKGPHCSKRQIISTDCTHCNAIGNNSVSFRSISSKHWSSSEPQEFSSKEGQFPPAIFAINSMKGQQNIKKLLGWQTEPFKFYKQNFLTYNLAAELISYCKSDVKLLKECFMEYRRLIQSVCSGIDPFEVACPAASACNFIYRQLSMPKDSIAILPQNG